MFRKLIRKIAIANFEAIAAKGGLACPKCGRKPLLITNDPDRLIHCHSCGTKALPGDWAKAAGIGGVSGNSNPSPAPTRITRTSERPIISAWKIPASGDFRTAKSVSVPGHGCFSILVTHLLKHNLPFAIASSVWGTLFLWVVLRFWSFESITPKNDDLVFFQLLESTFALIGNLFRCIVLLVGGSAVACGIFMIIRVFRKHGQETRFEGNESTITIRRLRRGRVLAEKSFSRVAVSDIVSSVSSSTGGITSKRIQLIIADKAETVATSITADQADAVVAEIRQAMGIS